LKNTLRLRGSNAFTRSLVVVQFALSVFLIAGTLVMLDQLDYLRSRDLGFDKEHLVVVDVSTVDREQTLGRLRDELSGHPEIAAVTGTSYAFTRGVSREGFEHEGRDVDVVEYKVQSDFLDVLGMELTNGRAFDPRLATDSTDAIIVNESLVRQFGWTESVGRKLTGLTESPETDPVVIGVVKDFNFRSLHSEVDPMMLRVGPRRDINYMLVRLNPGNVPDALDWLQTTWNQIAPNVPFQYSFLDEDLDRQYRAEERWSRIIGYGSFFAVLIACLGLFGLTALTVAGRTKEIGIRKVLGASVHGVTLLVSRDFVRLVLVAVVLATPAAYFAMHRWLDDFAFHIDLGPGVFLLAGALALIVALLTIAYQTIRAALSDPVKSLRYE
jgi:putative ABC transport system permease protein